MNWKRNLVFVWLSQFFSLTGFGFGLPFVAYYMQKDLGVTEPNAVKFWVGLFQAATPLTLAIAAPVWGVLADRYGRKLMMLRANFGAAVVLSLMGLARSVEFLVALRLLQGAFTGTMSAAQTLVASYTPESRHGVALGALSSAAYSGMVAGMAMGGVFAHYFGYRNSFYVAGGLVLISALLVMFGVRERFERPAEAAERAVSGWRRRLPRVGTGGPILLLILAMSFVRQFDSPMLPLLVQEIHGRLQGAELWASGVFIAFSLGAVAAGFVLGRAADRFRPASMARVCAVAAGVCMVPQALARGFGMLMTGRFAMAFFAAGMDPVFQVWLARVTPAEKRGSVFGWSVTARSAGWCVAPLLSAAVGAAYGVRASFVAAAILFVGLIPVINFVAGRVVHPAADGVAAEAAHADGD